jgi:hypothetical protein
MTAASLTFTRVGLWETPARASGLDLAGDDWLTYATPVIGPTGVLTARLVARELCTQPSVTVPADFLAQAVGLSELHHTVLVRTLDRLARFGVILRSASEIGVARCWLLTTGNLQRLPPLLAASYLDVYPVHTPQRRSVTSGPTSLAAVSGSSS